MNRRKVNWFKWKKIKTGYIQKKNKKKLNTIPYSVKYSTIFLYNQNKVKRNNRCSFPHLKKKLLNIGTHTHSRHRFPWTNSMFACNYRFINMDSKWAWFFDRATTVRPNQMVWGVSMVLRRVTVCVHALSCWIFQLLIAASWPQTTW